MLYKILSITRYLARQGLPLRDDATEINSNFMQLFLMRGESDPRILEWLKSIGLLRSIGFSDTSNKESIQPGRLFIYCNLQDVLIKAVHGEEYVKE